MAAAGKSNKSYERNRDESAAMFSNADLKRLIFPLVIEQALALTVGMADVMMVSYAGEAAVSGVSLVDMINVLLINIFAALATGGAVVTAQYLGARNRKKACESADQLMVVTIVISIFIMGLTLLFQRPLLRLFFGAIEDDVMSACITYLWISALSYPFLAVYNSCAALFRAMGNSKVSMLVSLAMNVINVAGNAFFYFYLPNGCSRRGYGLPDFQGGGLRHHGGAAEQSGASGFYQLKMGISQAGFPGYQEDFTYWNSQWLGKQLFSAGQSFGGQHHFRVRNRPDRRQRGGK